MTPDTSPDWIVITCFVLGQVSVAISLVLLWLWITDGRAWYEVVAAWLERRERRRTILDRQGESLYLSRYYLIGSRQSRWFSVAIHCIHRGDSDPHRHNHPWWCWASIVLGGGYWEDTPAGWRYRRAGDVTIKGGSALHRIELDPRAGAVWTLFIMGPKRSSWSFATPEGLVDHDEYLFGDQRRWRARAETERILQFPEKTMVWPDLRIEDHDEHAYNPDTDSIEKKR